MQNSQQHSRALCPGFGDISYLRGREGTFWSEEACKGQWEGWSSGDCGECDGTREVVFGESHKEPSLLRYRPWSSLETHTVRSVFKSSLGSGQGARWRRLLVLNVPIMPLLCHLPSSSCSIPPCSAPPRFFQQTF